MKTFVKLTGIRDGNAAAMVPDGGAGGFLVDVPATANSLTADRAAELVGRVPKDAEAWAVVVDPSAELIHRLFDEVGVDRIQVYGAIPPGLEFLEVHHLVPSLPIPAPGTAGPEPKVPPAEDYPRLHLDSVGSPVQDGSSVQPDWEMCARIVDSQPGRKLVLAGGLTADNVGQALAAVRPWGVDVSKGIENPAGEKDPERIRGFLRAVEAAETKVS